MDELKKCPFCGAKAEIINTPSFSVVVCYGCGAQTFPYLFDPETSSQEKAIKAWNRRITDERV